MNTSCLELKLFGPIGASSPANVGAVRTALESNSFDRIHVRINSRGGCADMAFQIYEELRAQPFPIMATACGNCQSAALIVFLAGSLRCAKADAVFLDHPAGIGRDLLPDPLTAAALRKHAESLSKMDDRVAHLLTARTGFDHSWFVEQGQTELEFAVADVIGTGLAHHFEGLTRFPDPKWPETVRVVHTFRNVSLPAHLTSPNYYEACRIAGFFRTIVADA